MRKTIFAALVLSAASAFAEFRIAVAELPPAEFADTETSTNLVVAMRPGEVTRLSFSVSLLASPSNAVEVAVGTDADSDGRLALDETDWAFGWDCGSWYARGTARDTLSVEAPARQPVSATSRVERAFVLSGGAFRRAWNLVKVTRRGRAEADERVLVEGLYPGFGVLLR